VVGMSGTGSNTIVSDEVFVPAHRYHSMERIMDGDYGTPVHRGAAVPGGVRPVPR